MELNVLNEQGKTVEAADAVFGREYNEALVHQIVVAFQAKAEQEDVPRRYGFDLLEARCRCSLCRR